MWDNARPQAAAETRHFLTQHDMEQVKQSPHSPDLNLCDRFLFRKLKHLLRDDLFRTHEEATSAVQRAMKMIDENELFDQLKKLREHCKDVITAGGDYIYWFKKIFIDIIKNVSLLNQAWSLWNNLILRLITW